MTSNSDTKIVVDLENKETASLPVVNIPPSNRSGRRKDIKIWNKLLLKHITKKPEYNVSDPSSLSDTDFEGLEKIREWITTFNNIKQKLNDLGVK